jgi:50S ribosomal protein L16 3-hydroxylase
MDKTFSFLPRWRRDDAQVSLANQGGGIGPHVDNYDVFLIQTLGKRQWHVGCHPLSAQSEHDMTIPGIPVRILSRWDEQQEDVISFLLEPGDVLYLPPRYPHWGIATTNRCMTLSVGCHAPSAADLVAQVAERMVNRLTTSAVSRYQDLDLIVQSPNHMNEITKAVKDDMKSLVLNAVQDLLDDDDSWDELVGSLVTAPKRPREDYPLALSDTEWRGELGVWGNAKTAVEAVRNGKGSLYRAEGVSAAFSRISDGSYRLFMNGIAFHIPVVSELEKETTEALLSAIVGDPVLNSMYISPLSNQPAVLELLETLVEMGLLYGSNDED